MSATPLSATAQMYDDAPNVLLLRNTTPEWLVLVVHALKCSFPIALVAGDDVRFPVHLREGQEPRDFVVHELRDALLLVEQGCFALEITLPAPGEVM